MRCWKSRIRPPLPHPSSSSHIFLHSQYTCPRVYSLIGNCKRGCTASAPLSLLNPPSPRRPSSAAAVIVRDAQGQGESSSDRSSSEAQRLVAPTIRLALGSLYGSTAVPYGGISRPFVVQRADSALTLPNRRPLTLSLSPVHQILHTNLALFSAPYQLSIARRTAAAAAAAAQEAAAQQAAQAAAFGPGGTIRSGRGLRPNVTRESAHSSVHIRTRRLPAWRFLDVGSVTSDRLTGLAYASSPGIVRILGRLERQLSRSRRRYPADRLRPGDVRRSSPDHHPG